MNFTLLVAVLLTAIAFVGIVIALSNILFFLIILVLGLAYAWRKGALEWK